uniref:Immediate early response 3-interacting protein 1 n=1 Tax=Parascaris equorum TaxID=6256 RepID=A0A914RAR3_PAREQ
MMLIVNGFLSLNLEVLLVLVNALILTGFGQYNSSRGGKHQLMLTADKWFYRS